MSSHVKSLTPMVVTCLIAGVVLTILAPYGTGQFNLLPRLIYWVGLCLVGGLSIAFANLVIIKRTARIRPFPLALIHSAASSLAVFAALCSLTFVTDNQLPALKYLALTFFYVWVIAFTISLIGMFMSREVASGTPERPALYDRLKPALRKAEIYALAAEDHYVRVITSKGEDLILMRLSDAIAETQPLTGLSPHRSWWVAEQGVAQASRKTITLHAGPPVPVSRAKAQAVKEAGWI